jgi:hypothetical protein
MAAKVVNNTASEGANFGVSITDKIGFYGLTTPIAQRAGSAQDAVATSTITTAATSTTPWGYAPSTPADAVAAQVVLNRTLVNEMRASMVALNLIKGAA